MPAPCGSVAWKTEVGAGALNIKPIEENYHAELGYHISDHRHHRCGSGLRWHCRDRNGHRQDSVRRVSRPVHRVLHHGTQTATLIAPGSSNAIRATAVAGMALLPLSLRPSIPCRGPALRLALRL